MFRSLFQDHLQELSFALSAYHTSAACIVIYLYWYVVVCPLFVFVSSVPACVLSGRETKKKFDVVIEVHCHGVLSLRKLAQNSRTR
jgi:hypothetical protein